MGTTSKHFPTKSPAIAGLSLLGIAAQLKGRVFPDGIWN
jgi:hypothetical protein